MTDKPIRPEAVLSSRGLRARFGGSRPGQTHEQIADYYRNVKEGDVAVIRETYARRLWFIVTTIDGKNPKLGRVYLKDAPSSGYSGFAFYMKSGKNYQAPKGQCSIVVPTPEVLEHAAKYLPKDLGESYDIDVTKI
jgi:hypothetical protein